MSKLIAFVIFLSSLVGFQASAQNLVANPGFEAGLASWISPINGFFAAWSSSVPPRTGLASAATGCIGAGCISTGATGAILYQDIATVPGTSYTVSFWYRTFNGNEAPVELQALFGAIPVTTGGPGTCTGSCIFGTQTSTATWTQVTRVVVATAATTRLMFLGRDDPAAVSVDDVSVTVTASNPATVPTLDQYALAALAMLLGLLGMWRFGRGRAG